MPAPASAISGPRRSVCLCMIVRDEADVIARCLESARPHIDRWIVCDTGSTDGTPERVARALEGVPGELHHHAWVDFAHNRTRLMQLARWRADYLLSLDADNVIDVSPGGLDDLRGDAYMIRHQHEGGGTSYHVKRLVSGSLNWFYVGAVHEYIETDRPHVTNKLDGVMTRSFSVGAVRHGRWERDAVVLEAAVAADPGDARARFYLARTYHDLGDLHADPVMHARAIGAYEARAALGGWHEEWYYALYQAGSLHARLGHWGQAIERFCQAWQLRPERLEALYELIDGLLVRGQYRGALQFTQIAVERPLKVPDDVLFVARAVWEWGLLAQHVIACLGVGEWEAAESAARRLLAVESLPPDQRRAAEQNLEIAFRGRTGATVEAFYAGNSEGN